jgi:hypothetical protein
MTRTYKTLEAAAKKLGGMNGYSGAKGGWVSKNGRTVTQGWWNMGMTFQRRGYITGNDRDGFTLVVTDLSGKE